MAGESVAAAEASATGEAASRLTDGAQVMREARKGVLDALLRWSAWAVVPVLAVVAAQTYIETLPRAPLYGLSALLLPLLLLRAFSERLSYRSASACFLAIMLLVALYGEVLNGFTPASALANAAFLLLAGLLFGARAVGWALLICVAGIGVAGVLFISGMRSEQTGSLFDAGDSFVWVRYSLVLASLGGGLAAAYVRLLNALQKAIAGLSESMQRTAREREERLAAQRALERHARLDSLAQVASGMAHDFNNSLMVMLGGAELIATHPAANAEIRHLAEDIAHEARASADGVKRVLALSRPSVPEPDELLASQLLTGLERAVRHLLPDGVTLKLQLRGDAKVRVDRARVQQALLNLAINARDAMPGGGTLTLGCELREVFEVPPGVTARPGLFVVIALGDTGHGIDRDTMEHIFEPFFTTKEHGKGTGLGLPTARAAVQAAGGFLQVTSEPGAGSCFEAYLPCDARSATGSLPSRALQDAPAEGHG